MEVQFIYQLEDLEKTAEKILELCDHHKIIMFNGEMGSGKTSLVKALCLKKNIKEDVSSPTFSIINEYKTQDGEKIFHFDLYRINNSQEAAAIGLSEYLDSGNLCLVEWPEVLPEYFLSRTGLKINLFHIDKDSRRIQISNQF